MDQENDHQRALRLWITAGLSIPEVVDLKGDAGYLFNNMIAKYTLAANKYALSEAALKRLKKDGVNIENTYIRRKFYGKKSRYIYEHAIPAKTIRTRLLESDKTESAVVEILSKAGKVTILLREENEKLKKLKLRAAMPPSWKLGADPEARYKEAGIKISKELLKVTGAIVR